MNTVSRAWSALHPGLELAVAPEDDVQRFGARDGRDAQEALCEYLAIGSEIADTTEQCLAACGLELARLPSLFDFGSGHGRSTRFLVRRIARERIVVCDAVERAVAFQIQHFGVRGVVGLDALGAQRFPAITSFGVFSNLPEHLFKSLLRALFERLERGGVLVVTTDTPEGQSGFEYVPRSESSVLGGDVYGAARCSGEWFEALVTKLPGLSFVLRARNALNRCQDVWVLGRERAGTSVPLELAQAPWIEVDSAAISNDGVLAVSGWALDGRRAPVSALHVLVSDAELVPRVRERPDVAAHFGAPGATQGGFELATALDGLWPRHVVVRARDAAGRTTLTCKRITIAPRAARTPDAAEAAVLARVRKGRDVLAYGGLFEPYEPDLHPTGLYPHLAERVEGAKLWDTSGREYLDWFLGWGPMLLGHKHPAVEAAIEAQLRIAPASSLMHDLEIQVAEQLTRMIPCAERVAFGKNGSDVTLAAVRVARAATGREVVVACGYHGFHDWCMAQFAWCAGVPSVLRAELPTFPYGDLEALERVLDAHRGRVAAVILEPTANVLPPAGFLEGVQRLARAHGAVLVFDEMVTGFRIARGGAQEAYGVVPDLACFGKALSNGMPLAALVGRAEILAHLPRVGFGLTYRGELLSLAAARACLAIHASEPVAEHVNRIGESLRTRFAALASEHGVGAWLQGFAGRMTLGCHGANGISPAGVKKVLVQECLREGILTNGNFMPSYAHDDAVVDATCAALGRALGTTRKVLATGVLEPFLDAPAGRELYDP